MKVLYYVEKELAQFDPARRMRSRCEHLLVLCVLCIMLKGIWGWPYMGNPELSGSELVGVLVTPR